MEYLYLTIGKVGKDAYRVTASLHQDSVYIQDLSSLESALKEAEAIIVRERIKYEYNDSYRNYIDRNF